MASRLKTFLCCFNLRAGCNFIGVLVLIAGIAAFVGASTVLDAGKDAGKKDWAVAFTFYISGGIVAILSSAILFIGVM